VLTPGPVLHLRDWDGPAYDGVPSIGEHTDEVLGEAGLSAVEIAALRRERVVGGAT